MRSPRGEFVLHATCFTSNKQQGKQNKAAGTHTENRSKLACAIFVLLKHCAYYSFPVFISSLVSGITMMLAHWRSDARPGEPERSCQGVQAVLAASCCANVHTRIWRLPWGQPINRSQVFAVIAVSLFSHPHMFMHL